MKGPGIASEFTTSSIDSITPIHIYNKKTIRTPAWFVPGADEGGVRGQGKIGEKLQREWC